MERNLMLGMRQRRGLGWLAVCTMAVYSLVLGCLGFQQFFLEQQPDQVQPSFLDLLQLSIQLFVLQSGGLGLDGSKPWMLDVARFMAPLTTALAAVKTIALLFAERFRELRLFLIHDHVVVCGLGRAGLRIVEATRHLGYPVVAIEGNEGSKRIALARNCGAMILIGDATSPAMLQQARLKRARHLVAVCGNDATNAEIAIQARELARKRSTDSMTCLVHVTTPSLCDLLVEHDLQALPTPGFRFEFFNIYDMGARALLRKHRPFPDHRESPDKRPHLLIVGLGRMGESLIVHASRLWRRRGKTEDEKFLVSVIDKDAEGAIESLIERHPSLEQACALRAFSMDIQRSRFRSPRLRNLFMADPPVTMVFICLDDDSLALSAGLALAPRARECGAPIIVRMTENAGVSKLLGRPVPGSGNLSLLLPFQLLDEMCVEDLFVNGIRETLARASHENYLEQQWRAGDTPEVNSSMVPWEQLPDHLKESNRDQADDIGRKLRLINCGLVPLCDPGGQSFELTEKEIERLAHWEHTRWMERYKQLGWTHGPFKDDQRKTHPCLVPWDQLPDHEKEKDREPVRRLPGMLAEFGFHVCRVPKTGSASIL